MTDSLEIIISLGVLAAVVAFIVFVAYELIHGTRR